MRKQSRFTIAGAFLGALAVGLVTGTARGQWVGPVSSGAPSVRCKPGSAVQGILCFGSNCAYKLLYCAPVPGLHTEPWWPGSWFSEEDRSNSKSLAENYNINDPDGEPPYEATPVVGMACQSTDCDDVKLARARRTAVTNTTVSLDYCQPSPFVSDKNRRWWELFPRADRSEGDRIMCPKNHFVGGVACEGHNCRYLSALCCHVAGLPYYDYGKKRNYNFNAVDNWANLYLFIPWQDAPIVDFKTSLPVGTYLPKLEGFALAVVRENEGQIYAKSYGKFARDRVSMLASVSKTLSAGVILSLVDDEKLDLNTPVREYLWPHDPNALQGHVNAGVTMNHLLSMMSGLPGGSYTHPCAMDFHEDVMACGRKILEAEASTHFPYVFRDVPGKSEPTCEERSHPCDEPIGPGKEFRYGANHWSVALAVAQAVSGEQWEELVKENLIEPCGLSKDTSYVGYQSWHELPEFAAYSTHVTEQLKWPASKPYDPQIGGGTARTIGGAKSTVDDLSKVLLMHLYDGLAEKGRALTTAMIREMRRDHVKLPGVEIDSPVSERRKFLANLSALQMEVFADVMHKKNSYNHEYSTIRTDIIENGVKVRAQTWRATSYGLGLYRYVFYVDGGATAVPAYVGPGGWGSRLVLVPQEGWGAALILEAHTIIGDDLLAGLFPLLREAVLAGRDN